jgi:hypothetical protein
MILRPSAKKVRFVPEPEFHFRFPSVKFPKVAGQTPVIPIPGTVGGLVASDSFDRTPSWLWATPEHPRSHDRLAHFPVSLVYKPGTTLNRMRLHLVGKCRRRA